MEPKNNFAYIDGANLHKGTESLSWKFDYKEVIFDGEGKAKGNCDADIVVRAMQDAYEEKFSKAVLVSSDGDFSPLVKFLISKNKIETILSPYDTKKCSVLLKRTGVKIAYISEQHNILEYRKK